MAAAACHERADSAAQPVTSPARAPSSASVRRARLERVIERLTPLHAPLPAPAAGEWLAVHDEAGQTFAEYVASSPPPLKLGARSIVLLPIGEHSPGRQRVLLASADWLGDCLGLPVRFEDTLPESVIPAHARRLHPEWQVPQVLTNYVLHQVLVPRRAADAAVTVAVTASDLWPGQGWNFVFGQALPSRRVAVWSLQRYGDPKSDPGAFRLALRRAIKVGVHETGHLLGLAHCTAHPCVMNGTNSLEESDGRPLLLCPQCLAKVAWLTGLKPEAQLERLATRAAADGLDDERRGYERAARALRHAAQPR